MGLRQDKRSRDRQGAVSLPQESGPATSLRPTQGDQTGGFSTERSWRNSHVDRAVIVDSSLLKHLPF